MLDCDICFKVALKRLCQMELGWMFPDWLECCVTGQDTQDRMVQIMRLVHQVFQVGMTVGLALACVLKRHLDFIHVAILKKSSLSSLFIFLTFCFGTSNMTLDSIKVYKLFSFFQSLQPWQGHNPDLPGLATCVSLTGWYNKGLLLTLTQLHQRKTCCNQRASLASQLLCFSALIFTKRSKNFRLADLFPRLLRPVRSDLSHLSSNWSVSTSDNCPHPTRLDRTNESLTFDSGARCSTRR